MKNLIPKLIATVLLTHLPAATFANENQSPNRTAVADAFERWTQGTGNPFELLAEDATWTILGPSPTAATYSLSRLNEELLVPFNARIESPLVPKVHSIHEDGDTIIVLFEAETRLKNGERYQNSYAWFFRFEEGRVSGVTAVLDLSAFDKVLSSPIP